VKAQLTIEVRISQQGSYGNQFTLADSYVVELDSLGQFADVLVKIHETMLVILKQRGVKI
jgi:hypothetical protein